jgi:hypothetical protein
MSTLVTYEPRFLVHNNISYLVRLTKDKKSKEILGVDGPYQVAGEPGVSPEETAKAMKKVLAAALKKPALSYADMPQMTKDQLDGKATASSSQAQP